MKKISRQAIQRMVGGAGTTIGGSGIGGGGDLAGYATEMWTEDNYVNKEFFSSLFKAYDANGNEVLPNDTTTTIDNIKAMFGFWTDFWLSALGKGNQTTVGLRLSQLADVNVAGVQNDQVLKYDATSQKWVPGTASSGTDMATVWVNLAAADNTKQIDISHLTTALTGYATQTWVGQQGYQTQTTADGRYLKLLGGTMTGPLTMMANQYATSSQYALNMSNSDIINVNSIWTSDVSDGWTEGIQFKRSNGNHDSFRAVDGDFYMNNNNGSDGACLHVSRLVLSCTNDAQGTAWNSPALCVGGNYSGSHIEIDSNEIMAKSNASTTTTLYLNAEGGNCVINETAGNCGIGTGSPSHKLHVNGGIYSTSYVTALSDERQKDIMGDVELTVEHIASARTVLFRWKDKRDNDLHMGCIAQDWQALTPQLVHDRNDELSMEYGVIAAIGTVKNSRRLVNHETRLRRLEKMFALNDNDLED